MSDHAGGAPSATTTERSSGASAAAGASEPSGSNEPDWTVQVTDLVVDTVDKVRERTTGPILEISRSSVHAVVAMIVLFPVLVMALVGVIRLLNWAVPGDVWIIYAGLGTIFSLLGVLLWSRRTASS